MITEKWMDFKFMHFFIICICHELWVIIFFFALFERYTGINTQSSQVLIHSAMNGTGLRPGWGARNTVQGFHIGSRNPITSASPVLHCGMWVFHCWDKCPLFCELLQDLLQISRQVPLPNSSPKSPWLIFTPCIPMQI